MKIDDWQKFYDSLEIDSDFYGSESPQKPSIRKLNSFESKHGLKLPASYRDYILIFGPGELGCSLQIASPGCADLGDTWDLWLCRESHTPTDFDKQNIAPESKSRLERLFIFAVNNNEDFIGWDPDEVSAGNEYAIYRVRPQLEVEFVAPSFRQLIEGFWDEVVSDKGWDEDELGSRKTFRPASLS